MKKSEFLYRRQFIFGPKKDLKINSWNKIEVTDEYIIYTHHDLDHAKYQKNDNFIILLGYILDPFNPDYNNLEIIRSCLDNINKIDDIFELLKDKCGRYVAIIKFNNEKKSCGKNMQIAS